MEVKSFVCSDTTEPVNQLQSTSLPAFFKRLQAPLKYLVYSIQMMLIKSGETSVFAFNITYFMITSLLSSTFASTTASNTNTANKCNSTSIEQLSIVLWTMNEANLQKIYQAETKENFV